MSVASKRPYHYRGLDWRDPDMRRQYNRDAQRRWRAANKVKKGARS